MVLQSCPGDEVHSSAMEPEMDEADEAVPQSEKTSSDCNAAQDESDGEFVEECIDVGDGYPPRLGWQ